MPLGLVFTKLNQVVRGWINYFRPGSMKVWLRNDFGPWMRHKVRVVILKQWKKPKTIYRNLMRLNIKMKYGVSNEEIYKAANSGLGWFRRSGMNTVNYLLSPKVLALPNKKENRPGLVDPLAYYLGMVIVPSRVHFCLGKWDFEAGRGKNPNFREVKREAEKRQFG